MMVNIPRYPLPVKAKLIPKDPTQRIRDRTTNEARDTPKIVWVSTSFSQRHDIQFSYKSEDMSMEISKKGCDVSIMSTLSELWTRSSKPPQKHWMLPCEQYAVRRSPRSN